MYGFGNYGGFNELAGVALGIGGAIFALLVVIFVFFAVLGASKGFSDVYDGSVAEPIDESVDAPVEDGLISAGPLERPFL